MTTINELIQNLTPFSAQKNVGKAIAALNTLAVPVKNTEIENSAQQLINLLTDKNTSLSDVAFEGVMTLTRLKQGASSSASNAGSSASNPEAIVKVKSLLGVGLIGFSDVPALLSRMEEYYAKDTPNRSSFFGFSTTANAAPSVSSSSASLNSSL